MSDKRGQLLRLFRERELRLIRERHRHLTALRRITTLQPVRGARGCIRQALICAQSIAAAELFSPVQLGLDKYDSKTRRRTVR